MRRRTTYAAAVAVFPTDADLYGRLGVRPDADPSELRAAYRRLARAHHPDLIGVDGRADDDLQRRMAEVNEAWSILSDPARRHDYDRTLAARRLAATVAPFRRDADLRPPAARRPQPGERREAWLQSIRVRIRFLAALAGRSAVQTLLVRHPGTARLDWEERVGPILDLLVLDTEARVRAARAAGAAPLDLANAALLVGLLAVADQTVEEARRRGGATEEDRRRAELVDRMFATLAHELPFELVRALGDAPRTLRRLR